MRAFFQVLFLFSFLSALAGCAGESRVFQESIAVIRQVDKFNDVAQATSMTPNFGYLRVHSARGAILMLWTFTDRDPESDLPIDIWQSGSKEIAKLQGGRIVATAGFESDWLAARYLGVPNWTYVLANPNQASYNYQRVVDLKTSYQFGKTEKITLIHIPQPVGHALAGVQQPAMVWFEEKVTTNALPPNIYGVVPNWNNSGQAKVVYTWHCFKVSECMGFQVWTTVDQAHLKSAKP